ncbi:MAG: hypothetical protein OXU42_03970 [Deltaproteobacteria bacterium]|nr:hypothetical protein [Deltaproteobacteria bacterium]
MRPHASALEGSVPFTDVLSGELYAEADIEPFAFDIKGADRISSPLPAMNGLDRVAVLAWSAPVRGSPSVFVGLQAHDRG